MAVTPLSPGWGTLDAGPRDTWRAAYRAVSRAVWESTDDLVRAAFRAVFDEFDEFDPEEPSW